MLLQMLRQRGTTVVPGYQPRKIACIIDVADSGAYTVIANPDDRGKPGGRLLMPYRKRSVAPVPMLFADGADYLFGIPDAGASEQRAQQRRDLHLALAQRCADSTPDPAVTSVVSFLVRATDDPDLRGSLAAQLQKFPGDVAFRVAGTLVTDLPAVQDFWAAESSAAQAGAAAPGTCFVCGNDGPIPEMWPVAIKGGTIPGGQTSGIQLVSMNADVFESYGQRRAVGSMTCGPCAERIVNALNEFLSDPHGHTRVGEMVYVYWTDTEQDFAAFDLLALSDPGEVELLLAAPFSARSTHLQATSGRLFGAGLSAYGPRAVIRDWVDVAIPDARKHLAAYFAAQTVCGLHGEGPAPIRLTTLAAATVRDYKDVPPTVIGELFRHAVLGHQLPLRLLADTIRRARVGDPVAVTRPQAALIRMVLISHFKEMHMPTQLDPAIANPAYVCGRLLAEINEIQYGALGKVNASVVDRYFGAASTRPATVFGPLLTNTQHHLGKLRSSGRGGSASYHDGRLAEIMAALPTFPATLTLQDQGWFCLGFYHERAHLRRAVTSKKIDSSELGEAVEPTSTEEN